MNNTGYFKLKCTLFEKGIKQKTVANILGISVPTFNKKLNGTGSDFSVTEARNICKNFNIDSKIFFN